MRVPTTYPNVWEQDSVEIFVDQNNGKTDVYQEDDGQYRMNFNNARSFGGHAGEDNFVSARRLSRADMSLKRDPLG